MHHIPHKYQKTVDNFSLKYGLCSYFSLAYVDLFGPHTYIMIMEIDPDTLQEYLVHVVLQKDKTYIDSLGEYASVSQSIREISDIEHMDLVSKTATKDQLINQIVTDFQSFNYELYDTIRTYVRNEYS